MAHSAAGKHRNKGSKFGGLESRESIGGSRSEISRLKELKVTESHFTHTLRKARGNKSRGGTPDLRTTSSVQVTQQVLDCGAFDSSVFDSDRAVGILGREVFHPDLFQADFLELDRTAGDTEWLEEISDLPPTLRNTPTRKDSPGKDSPQSFLAKPGSPTRGVETSHGSPTIIVNPFPAPYFSPFVPVSPRPVSERSLSNRGSMDRSSVDRSSVDRSSVDAGMPCCSLAVSMSRGSMPRGSVPHSIRMLHGGTASPGGSSIESTEVHHAPNDHAFSDRSATEGRSEPATQLGDEPTTRLVGTELDGMITVVREVGMDDLTGSGFVQPAVDIQCCPNDSCRRDDIVDRLRQALTIVLTDSEDADSEDAVTDPLCAATDPLCAATDPLCAATDPQDAVVENHSVEGNPLEKDSGNNSGEAEGARVRDVRPDDQGWSDWNEWKKTSPLLNEDLGLLPLDILKKVAVMLGLKSNVGTHILHRAGTRVEDSDRRHLLARK